MLIRDRIVSALRSAHQVCRAINDPGLELISARGALRASEQFWGSSDILTASVRADLAECLSRRGRKEGALLLCLKNIEVLPNANTTDDPKILMYFA